MNEVHILIITNTKETTEDRPEVTVSVYRDMERAITAYNFAVEEARSEAEERYEWAHEDSEICTDSYRYFRIEEMYNYESITIEIQTKEIIGDDSDDL